MTIACATNDAIGADADRGQCLAAARAVEFEEARVRRHRTESGRRDAIRAYRGELHRARPPDWEPAPGCGGDRDGGGDVRRRDEQSREREPGRVRVGDGHRSSSDRRRLAHEEKRAEHHDDRNGDPFGRPPHPAPVDRDHRRRVGLRERDLRRSQITLEQHGVHCSDHVTDRSMNDDFIRDRPMNAPGGGTGIGAGRDAETQRGPRQCIGEATPPHVPRVMGVMEQHDVRVDAGAAREVGHRLHRVGRPPVPGSDLEPPGHRRAHLSRGRVLMRCVRLVSGWAVPVPSREPPGAAGGGTRSRAGAARAR